MFYDQDYDAVAVVICTATKPDIQVIDRGVFTEHTRREDSFDGQEYPHNCPRGTTFDAEADLGCISCS